MSSTSTDPAPALPDVRRCDVLVVGGGPAGSTIATLLARQGRQVVLVEKERHPRFHIGESLLPANGALFEQLGVLDQVQAIGLPKWGVEFNSPQHAERSLLEFADAWDKSMPMAWQVRRSELDELLFRNARAAGADCHEACTVRRVDVDADGATAQAVLDDGAVLHWRARFVVDASGRDTLLARQFDLKQRNPRHNSAALYGHYSGATRLPGRLEGHISIFWFRHGWFWFIPLADGTTSVGAVCWPHYLKTRRGDLPAFFAETIALCPALAARLQGAQLVDAKVYATGNYTYAATRSSGERYLLLGDAYAFLDPVFSSGVYLAMKSGFEGARAVATCLDEPARAPRARRDFDAFMRRGPREFSWFIYRMTSPAIRDMFMRPANPLRTKEAVLSLLAGDLYGRTPIRASLIAFKAIYYLLSLLGLPRTWSAWRLRRHHIRDVGAVPGENVMTPVP